MLEPWALRHKGWKKRVAWVLYQRRMLDSSALLHATSTEEGDNLRKLGLTARIGVVPNGTDLPSLYPSPAPDEKTCRSRRTLLFLSRIHPKKGLELLLEAWSSLRPRNWRIRIAGPGEDSYIQGLKQRSRILGVDREIEWMGPASGSTKEELFRSSDLFILPSYSENFGLVVAEALSYGVPVITTTGCPWAELPAEGAGWWVEPAVEPLRQALEEATNLPQQTLQELGRRGRRLVERNYGWDSVGTKMNAAYLGILGSPQI
jgi:glycosyltransferase involved in cell wall biosynthesis